MEDDEGLSHSERLDRILAGVKKETRGRRRSTKRLSTKRVSKRHSTKRVSKRRSGKRRSVRKISRKVRFGSDGDEAPPRPLRPSARKEISLNNIDQLKYVPALEKMEVSRLIWGDPEYLKGKIEGIIKKAPEKRDDKEQDAISILFELGEFYDTLKKKEKFEEESKRINLDNNLINMGINGGIKEELPLQTPKFKKKVDIQNLKAYKERIGEGINPIPQQKRESLSQKVLQRLSNLRQGVRVDPEQLKSLQPQPIKVGEYKHEHIDENDDGYV